MGVINLPGNNNFGGSVNPQNNPVQVTPTHTQYSTPAQSWTAEQQRLASGGVAATPRTTRMPWEAAVGQSANQLATAGTPNPGATMASSAPPPASGEFSWNAGANPFQQSVTATDMNGGTTPFNAQQYTTPEAAKRLAEMFGANAVSQNTGLLQGGGVSSPMHGLDFGAGDVQDTAWLATALNRGDPMSNIMARLQAGIAPPGGIAQRESPEYMGNQWNMNSPISSNLPQGQISSLAGGQAGIPSTSPFSGVKAATHLGPQGGGTPAPYSNQQIQQFQQQQRFPGQQNFFGGGQLSQEGPGAQQSGFNRGFTQQYGGFNPSQSGNMQGFAELFNKFLAAQGQGQMGPQRQPQLPNRVQTRQFPNSWYYPSFK